MERRQFFTLMSAGVAAAIISNAVIGCTKNTSDNTPKNVDFTLDINNAANAALKNNGGYVYQNNIIIARTSTGDYVALSSICTHAGCPVQFNGTSGFPCPCHGSVFASNGSVINGPATSPLARYNTSLNGNLLRVYS